MRTTKIAPATPFSGAPKINLASIFGASPNKPFLLRIPVTGERPIRYDAQNLPDGLTLRDNIITGQVSEAGVYEIMLSAENSLGKAEKTVTLEIEPNHVIVTPLLGFTTWIAINQDTAFAPSIPVYGYKKDNAILDVYLQDSYLSRDFV